MDRRTVLTTASAAAFAGTMIGRVCGQENKAGAHAHLEMNDVHGACLEACQSCESICNATLSHCLTHLSAGHKEHAACARSATTCQDLCGLSAKLIARGDAFAVAVCAVCAQACEACAVQCESMSSDSQMSICAKACRVCAAACKKMAA